MKNKAARDLFIALAFGDGYINKSGGLSIRHCLAQKEYLEWKVEKLSKAGFSKPELKYVTNNGYGGYEIYVGGGSKFAKLVSLLQKRHKYPISLFKRLSPLGLAIWYLDDGSISHKKNAEGKVKSSVLTISTCTTKENNQELIDYLLLEYGIQFGQRKMKNHYALVCGTKEARKFIELINPYVFQITCMQYKLIVKP